MTRQTYTAEEMAAAFYSFIFTDDTADTDLPDQVWLMVLACRFGELTGLSEDRAAQAIAQLQGLALKTRADGFEAFDLAAFLTTSA